MKGIINSTIQLRVSKELADELLKIKKEMKCSWSDASVILTKRMKKHEIELNKLKGGFFKI